MHIKPTVAIVGAGPSGLTLARSLAKQKHLNVRVFDAVRQRSDRGLGLWGRSQAALRALGIGHLLDDPAQTRQIPAAAYRSLRGAWLSASSDTMANHVRVSTLRESQLLQALEDGLPEGTVQRGMLLTSISPSANGDRVDLGFQDGTSVENAIIVGADGARSTVRSLVFGFDAVDTGYVSHSGLIIPQSGAEEEDLPEDGFLRNTAPIASLDPTTSASDESQQQQLAFETLSGGRRFAMVPLARGGAFWFATRRLDEGSDGEGVGAAAIRELRDAYSGWHSPIPAVMHAAACEAAEFAMAGGGRGGGGGSSTSTAAAAERPHPLRWERLYEAPPQLSAWHKGGSAVLIGDAAHAMPINLAQGAAAGIEGAYLLGEALNRLGSGSGALSADFSLAFREYQEAHQPRVWQCRHITRFTEWLAMPASPPLEAVRNAMRLVPQPLNGMVFDAALNLSLGDAPARTRKRWPLELGPHL